MCKFLIDNYSDIYEMIFIFANTGKELEETLIFANKCDKEFNLNLIWVEAQTNMQNGKGVTAKVVTFETASRNGEPFENMVKKHGLPNIANPFCTRELKDYTIKSYFRNQLKLKKSNYEIAIGIRADEIDRVSPKRKEQRFIYPLVELKRTTKPEINSFWNKMDFRLNVKSYQGNCDFCFKKSKRKLMTIAKENPEKLIFWSELENKYNKFIPKNRNQKTKLPIHIFRNNKNAEYFLNESKKHFILATDEKTNYHYSQELDFSGSCEDSCVAFSYT